MSILGHTWQIEYFEQVIKSGRIAHAYLFSGPEHVGKRTVVDAFLDALFSGRRFLFGGDTSEQHSSGFSGGKIFLSPGTPLAEERDPGTEISIADIRELKRRLSYRAGTDELRAVVIDAADMMTHEAVAAFLKLLEEPGAGTIFFLVTAHPDSLLPTIRSRAQEIRFSFVPDSLLEAFLKENHPGRAKEHEPLLTLAAGRPGALMRFLEDPGFFREERKKFDEMHSALTRGFLPDLFSLAEKIAGDPQYGIEWKQNLFGILRRDFIERVRRGAHTDIALAAKRLKETDRIATLLEETSVNPRLALDVLFLTARDLISTNHQPPTTNH